jgi:hypothetical protein
MAACGAAMMLATVGAANAQAMVDMTKVTCEQLLSASPNAIDAAVWLSGYYNGLRKNTMLNLNEFKKNAEAVVDDCRRDPKATLMQTIDTMLSKK